MMCVGYPDGGKTTFQVGRKSKRQNDRQTERENTERHRNRETDNKETEKWRDKETKTYLDRAGERERERHTGSGRDGKTDRQ